MGLIPFRWLDQRLLRVLIRTMIATSLVTILTIRIIRSSFPLHRIARGNFDSSPGFPFEAQVLHLELARFAYAESYG
jgi:hypothetical protein